jgi:hypothetical protein
LDVSRRTRAERLAMPLAREVVKDLAVEHGACIRPVQLRRTNLDTGADEQVLVPCGHTLASVCPACAQRAKTLRAAQCREGWHLDAEPVFDPDPATEDQKWWVEKRAEARPRSAGRAASEHGKRRGSTLQLAARRAATGPAARPHARRRARPEAPSLPP